MTLELVIKNETKIFAFGENKENQAKIQQIKLISIKNARGKENECTCDQASWVNR